MTVKTVNGVRYVIDLVSRNKWPTKCPYPMNAKKVTLHSTDNDMPAKNEASYHNSNNNQVSYHLVADEKEVRQLLPFDRNGWHSGDGLNGYGNRNTIAMEFARNYDRTRKTTNLKEPLKSQYAKAEENGIKVLAQIMIDEGIVANDANIKTHNNWNGKWCPRKILNEKRLQSVKRRLIKEYNRLVAGDFQEGWRKNNTGWWYRNADGSYPRGMWQYISKQWYLFDSKGYMLTGWQKSKDKWYYLNNSGQMQKGWIKLNSHWYYMDASGAMQRYWFNVGNVWYYANGSGQMQTGWLKDKHGRWFYLRSNGAMATGLLEVAGKHYFLQRDGVLITDDVVQVEANKHGHLA